MVRGYYEIAFVYGQSTYDIASEVKKNIEKKYSDYPIKIKLCDDSSFRKAKGDVSIDTVVQDEFEGVKFAIIFIGKDMLSYTFPIDNFQPPKNENSLEEIVKRELFGNKSQISPKDFVEWINKDLKFTLSQNAVFEMGHLWTKLSFAKMRFVPVFPKNDKSFKIPTDIPVKYLFYYNNGDKDFYDFIDNLIKVSPPIGNVLNDVNYQVDYKDLFTDDELEIIDSPRKKPEAQFGAINNLWTTQVMSLQKDEERLIFIYERLVFLSYFPYIGGYDYWLTTAIGAIQDKDTLFCKILILIRKYINERRQQGMVKGNKFESYKNIADDLCAIKIELQKQNIKINPLIEIYLNDYIGLACRATVEEFDKLENVVHFDREEYLKRSIDSLKRCSEIETLLASEASCLWSGYSTFNIARTYGFMGNHNESINSMADAYYIREKWLYMPSVGKMPRVFEQAFKAEYVLGAMNAINKGCFVDKEKKRVERLCEGVVETLKFTKVESIAIVEDTIRKYEDSLGLK